MEFHSELNLRWMIMGVGTIFHQRRQFSKMVNQQSTKKEQALISRHFPTLPWPQSTLRGQICIICEVYLKSLTSPTEFFIRKTFENSDPFFMLVGVLLNIGNNMIRWKFSMLTLVVFIKNKYSDRSFLSFLLQSHLHLGHEEWA